MVTISNYYLRESKVGEEFISLELQGDLELVQSMQTGKFYATAKRCTITSTFSEEVAKEFIGRKLPGSIVRVQTEAYDYTVPETGEVISLAHTYQYVPEENSLFELNPARSQEQLVAG
jgi:hypothetical protein